ncbi:MAG: trypsin-like peptidase domain-containing protein [Chloroflexi bacterium]|nr:trypsin-like peptidase domain-containing protein [Chloroflexota bacterium]MCC6893013.1 trypsin-like peptidase domain-containing protein [Anaerolineae bacterium]
MLSNHAKRSVTVVAALVMVVFGFVLGTSVMSTTAHVPAIVVQQAPVATSVPSTESERAFSDIYNRLSPSVVSIVVSGMSNTGAEFGGAGTGFVVDTNGHIVTNDHVVAEASEIEVNFFDGTIVKGTVVGLDPDSDLAVIKVDLPANELTPVTMGDSDTLFIGQTTLAIGSPFNQRWTLTTGIISALDRTISGQTTYSVGSAIQTDAAINPGNSGGPLINLQGEVIGMNSQILSQSNSSSGVGFAIPSNLIKHVADQIINTGKVEYSYLGISAFSGVNLDLIEALNIPNNTQGVVIGEVSNNSPAEKAGLQSAGGLTNRNAVPTSADIITAIDGHEVKDMSELVSYLASSTTPGQTVTLQILRDGQPLDIPVTLEARPVGN